MIINGEGQGDSQAERISPNCFPWYSPTVLSFSVTGRAASIPTTSKSARAKDQEELGGKLKLMTHIPWIQQRTTLPKPIHQ